MDILNKLNSVWPKRLSRKEFIGFCVKAGAGAVLSSYLFDMYAKYNAFASIGERRGMRRAAYWEKISNDIVRCRLCPEGCLLKNGERGFCRVREPLQGELYTLVYSLLCALHIDPIEKKPLFHFLPGTKAFSIAASGCNSRCKFCQNWSISQRPPEQTSNFVLRPNSLASGSVGRNCRTIAYTYTEPFVFFEYVRDSSSVAAEHGLKNIIVTGGKINTAPLIALTEHIDGANVDLKGFDEKYLKDICAQDLRTIQNTLLTLKKEGVWVEITNLIVPTLNDDLVTIRQMCKWIYNELGPEVPLHFSRFWPQYKLRHLYPTPIDTLLNARDTALSEGMKYVYVGNVPEERFQNTYCPDCENTVIKRKGYRIFDINMHNGKCSNCGTPIKGVWQ
jgi:pyruvate formate lyase activating enzyme